jgi:phenylalanyl-tRNA synthetase beta chain
MKLPLSWLAEFVDLSGLTAQEVAERLSESKFLVEKTESIGPELTGPIVVGKIMEINPHPNADRIRLTKTKVDENAEPLEIVCGAHNIEVGHVVPVALPGAKVVNRHDGTELVIKVSKIRGVESNGMLCSPSELGITDGGDDGILILPDGEQLKLGLDVKEFLAPRKDVALHVLSKSDREAPVFVCDLANELASILKQPSRSGDWQSEFHSSDKTAYEIEIEKEAGCEFYGIRSVNGLKAGHSPLLIKRRIEAAGLKTVNNIVDIINCIHFEYGHSPSVYDADQVDGEKIKVRRAHVDETFKTSSGQDCALNPEITVICDSEGVIAVAGIAGGIDTAVSDKTTNVALEVGKFDKDKLQHARQALNIPAPAWTRFEAKADPATLRLALNRATYLLLKHCAVKGQGSARAIAYAVGESAAQTLA